MTDDRLLIRLKYGVWNQWREEYPGIVINLDGAALDGMVLTGIDFSGVSLRGASLHATNLMNADLSRADLTGANERVSTNTSLVTDLLQLSEPPTSTVSASQNG